MAKELATDHSKRVRRLQFIISVHHFIVCKTCLSGGLVICTKGAKGRIRNRYKQIFPDYIRDQMGAELTKDGIKNKKTEVESQQDISIPVESKRSILNTATKREKQ